MYITRKTVRWLLRGWVAHVGGQNDRRGRKVQFRNVERLVDKICRIELVESSRPALVGCRLDRLLVAGTQLHTRNT